MAPNANPMMNVAASAAAMCGTAPSSSTPTPIPTRPHNTSVVSVSFFAA